MSALINAACRAGDDGMHVFPVKVSPDPERPGKNLKQPLTGSWPRDSSNDPEVIARMNWGNATHFGIDCEKSGIWVVDIDDRSVLATLPLSHTRIQETISGGLHYIYKAGTKFDQRNTTHAPVEHVDIRANGGFIVWYGIGEMIEDDLRPWPFDKLVVKLKGARHTGIAYEPGPIGAGGRNNDAISAAGYFMGAFPTATVDVVVSYLVGHSSMNHTPPLSIEEVRKVATSAMRWRKEDTEIKAEEYFGKISGMPAVTAPRSLCGEWLRAGTLSMLYARAGVGKTAWLAELVFSLRHGLDFMGMNCEKVPRILWINGDLPAWQIRERIGYLDDSVDLWHIMFDDLMLRQDEVFNKCLGYDLVVMDNRPALFDLGDAIAAEAWKPLMNLLRQICNTGCAVIVATHGGKGLENTSSFGSSAQEWQLDNNLRLAPVTVNDKDEASYVGMCSGKIPTTRVSWEKHRMCRQPQERIFYMREVLFADNIEASRLTMEWKCFYTAEGKPLVKPTRGST